MPTGTPFGVEASECFDLLKRDVPESDLLAAGRSRAIRDETRRPVGDCSGESLQLDRNVFEALLKGIQVGPDKREQEAEKTACDLLCTVAPVTIEVDCSIAKD